MDYSMILPEKNKDFGDVNFTSVYLEKFRY